MPFLPCHITVSRRAYRLNKFIFANKNTKEIYERTKVKNTITF